MNWCEADAKQRAGLGARFILLQHEKSDLVHDVNLPGAQVLWAHDHIVRWGFAGRRVRKFVHVAVEVFQPAR